MKKHIPVCFVLFFVLCGVYAVGEEETALNVEVISTDLVEQDKISLTVIDSDGQFSTVKSAEALAQLKPGSYRVKSWIIQRKDNKGDTWQLKATRAKGEFTVLNGQTPKPKLGDPVTAKLSVSKSSRGYRFNAKIRTQLGEDVQVYLYDSRTSPVLRIINEPGTYDERFTFSYG